MIIQTIKYLNRQALEMYEQMDCSLNMLNLERNISTFHKMSTLMRFIRRRWSLNLESKM